jgi:hypothetical protein
MSHPPADRPDMPYFWARVNVAKPEEKVFRFVQPGPKKK